jgi:CheY-like chemotaxis protein
MGNSKMEILILDDNIANTRLTSQILSKILTNYQIPSQIDILNDSREAISKIIFNKYNIIFLDIKMPFISGIDILRQLKQLEYMDGNRMTRIFVSTALTDEVDSKEFENVVVLHKPVLYETFENIIVDYLAHESPTDPSFEGLYILV